MRVQWMPNLLAQLNAMGHKAELLTCDAKEMEARLLRIAKLRHARRYRDLGDAAPAFEPTDWVFPTLESDKEYVIGFNFAPKHMIDVYEQHFAGAGFNVVFVDAAHLQRGPGPGYKGGTYGSAMRLHARVARAR